MSDTPRDSRGAKDRPDPCSAPTQAARRVEPDPVLPTLVSDTPAGRPPVTFPVTFPGYEIAYELGRGGMGVVYKARQTRLNRAVALKVIIAGPHASPQDKARFHIEAEAVARLRHPNIVQVYDVGEHDGFAFIALEYVEGETLRRWQNGSSVEPREAARIAAAVGRALQHAHDNGIVHRDIKPANILITTGARSQETEVSQDGTGAALSPVSGLLTPKVTDFGLAKAMEGGADLTITGMACGTPNYMAPEQVRGTAKVVGPAVDVYSLGAVLYEMLTGRPPFSGLAAADVMDLIVHTDPPSIGGLNPRVPRDLRVIAEKCLEKDPARRYQTARSVVEDLENFLAGRPIRARRTGLGGRGVRWCRRNPLPAAFLVAATLGCAVTGTLAVALARSVAVERGARSEADRERAAAEDARQTAVDQKAAADAARQLAVDQRAAADDARQTAVDQKAAADAARAVAVEQQTRADEARKRAVEHLGFARSIIRTTLERLGDHPRVKGSDFREFRAELVRLADELRAKLADHAGNEPGVLADLGGIAHWTGYLEYLNGNMPAAAAHYLAAVDTYRQWAQAAPDDPVPLSRRAFSLTNAGNAFFHAGRFAESEARHREAIGVLDGLVARRPTPGHRLQLLRACAPLAEELRDQGRWADAEKVGREYLRRAREVVGVVGPAPETDAHLANALQGLGQVLARTGKRDAAECYLTEAVALWDRIAAGTKGQPGPVADKARVRVTLADHLAGRGRPDLALPLYAHAAALTDEVVKAAPGVARLGIVQAEASVALAEALRKVRNFERSEARFDEAIARLEGLTRRAFDPVDLRDARRNLVRALVGKGNLLNNAERHREAVAVWERLAKEDPNVAARWQHRMFVLQSLVFDRDWRAAAEGADKLTTPDLDPGAGCELARVWCRVARAAANDPGLSPDGRAAEAERAFVKAVALLERGKAAGVFRRPGLAPRFDADHDFDPIRDRFDPRD